MIQHLMMFNPDVTEFLVRLGWTLMHFLWQGTLIAIAYAIARFTLRHAAPQTRYLSGLATMLCMACSPVITFMWLTPTAAALAVAASPHVAAINIVHSGIAVAHPAIWLDTFMRWTAYTWLAGVTLFAIRLTYAWNGTLKLRAAAQPDAPQTWKKLLIRTSLRLGINQRLSLAISGDVLAPVVIGWIKPVILIPPSLIAGLSTDQFEMILLHELAHIKRHDYLINTLQMILETLLFYHPAVHWVSKQVRLEREYCCDDLAVESSGNRISYLKALATLETNRLNLTSAMAANGGSLLKRVQRIAYPKQTRRFALWPLILVTIATLGVTYSIHAELAPKQNKAGVISNAQQPARFAPTKLSLASLDKIQPANPIKFAVFHEQIMAQPVILPGRPPSPDVEQLNPIQPEKVSQAKSLPPLPNPEAGIVADFVPAPAYPFKQLRDDTPGSVRVSFNVTRNGYLGDVSTEMVAGPSAFADAARKALSRWKFKPLTLDDKAAVPHVELTMVFTPNVIGSTNVCVEMTGSHMCHHYNISFEDIHATLQYGKSLLVATNDDRGNTSIYKQNPDGSRCIWNKDSGCGPTASPRHWQPRFTVPATNSGSDHAPRYYSPNPGARVAEHSHPG